MSTQYTTEPPPTASVILHTTAGPLTLSLFAQQTPLTCRNFLQHVLDGYYENCLFHRVVPGFIIQTGDPTGTGEGGESIYEDGDTKTERYDELWARQLGRDVGERLTLGDEPHARLRFSRRGLVGMAKMDGVGEKIGKGGAYGSQFFITLGDCRAELDGKCTMFGRVEGDGIYQVVKIAEGENAEGTERPVYPFKITGAEVLEMPRGECWAAMKRRERVRYTVPETAKVKKKATKKRGGKALLSFEGDEEEGTVAMISKKPKFNPKLIDEGKTAENPPPSKGSSNKNSNLPSPGRRKESSPPPIKTSSASSPPSAKPTSPVHRRVPSFPSSNAQLPLKDAEVPSRDVSDSRSPSPHQRRNTASTLNAEIAALKASMRRTTAPAIESNSKKSALEAMIPATSLRGRKRPRPGDTSANNDTNALAMLNAFRARLDAASEQDGDVEIADAPRDKGKGRSGVNGRRNSDTSTPAAPEARGHLAAQIHDEDEAVLCDLHFVANCQSCLRWHEDNPEEAALHPDKNDDDNDVGWMAHALSFEKDRLGKDLTWKRKNEEELLVIDPREKERGIREKERERKRERRK